METETAIDSEYPNSNGHDQAAAQVELGRLPALIESLLFAAGAPVGMSRLVEALDGPERREVAAALKALTESYERDGRGLRLVQVAGGYQLRTPHEHAPWVRRLLRERPPRLSIVAYRQPCTRAEIEAVRGVEADAVLSTLLDRRLVRIVGRKDAPGRPLLYGTTREFLEVFGLPDLSALPTLRELGEAEILGSPELVVDAAGVRPPAVNGEDTEPDGTGAEPPGDTG